MTYNNIRARRVCLCSHIERMNVKTSWNSRTKAIIIKAVFPRSSSSCPSIHRTHSYYNTTSRERIFSGFLLSLRVAFRRPSTVIPSHHVHVCHPNICIYSHRKSCCCVVGYYSVYTDRSQQSRTRLFIGPCTCSTYTYL